MGSEMCIRDRSDSEFLIHALTDEVASGLPGDMESKVAKVFNERISK